MAPKVKLTKQEEREIKLRNKAEEDFRRKQEFLLRKKISDTKEYNFRCVILTDSIKTFEVVQKDIQKKLERKYRIEKWEKFLKCDRIPLPYQPSAIHSYLTQWYIERIKLDMMFNWMLECDERSFLTQNVYAKNNTRKVLEEQQPNFGDQLSHRIDEILLLLADLEYYLKTNYKNLSKPIMGDLYMIKCGIRTGLIDSLNHYTYRTLSNIERDMKTLSPISTNFEYESKCFKVSIWAQRHTPQPRIDAATPYIINFNLLDAQIKFPEEFKMENGAVRFLWMNFDHLSDFSETYNLSLELSKIIDMKTSNDEDWKKRNEIAQYVLEQMRLERRTYDEKQNALEEERIMLENKRKRSGKVEPKKRTAKKAKFVLPPPIVDEFTLPDIGDRFEIYDNELYLNDLQKIHEENSKLSSSDINLREYLILGGVFTIDYLESSNQPRLFINHSQITSIERPNILKLKPYSAPYNAETAANNEFVEITFQLSNSIYWFGEPILCQWEPIEIISTVVSQRCSEDFIITEEFPKKHKRKQKRISKPIFDFNLENIPSEINFHYIIVNQIIPRMLSIYQFPFEIEEETRIREKENAKRIAAELEERGIDINSDGFRKESIKALSESTQPSTLFRSLKSLPKTNIIQSDNNSIAILDEERLKRLMLSSYLSELERIRLKYDISKKINKTNSNDNLKSNELERQIRKSNVYKSSDKTDVIQDVPRGKWSTENIYDQEYDFSTNTIRFKVGTFGFYSIARHKYLMLPFTSWSLYPDSDNVVLQIISKFNEMCIKITSSGYELIKLNPNLTEGILETNSLNLTELKTKLTECGLNIFPERDAAFYINDVAEKHISLEMHTYTSMGIFGLTHSFYWSCWNKLSNRRSIVLNCQEQIDDRIIGNVSELLLTPECCTSVKTEEKCTPLTEVILTHSKVPEEQEYVPDLCSYLHNTSGTLSKRKQEKMKNSLKWNISKLLQEIRPLSFSK